MYTVMLLDDEPWELRGMRAMIPWAAHGFQVQHALSDATQALDILLHQAVDVLLTDIRMPQLSGVDLLVRLREAQVKTAVVFLSGYAEFAYAQTALKMGAFDYLLKPFDQQDMPLFLNRLREHLDGKAQVASLLLFERLLYQAEALETVLPECAEDAQVQMLMCKAAGAYSFPCPAFRLPCARDAWLYLLVYRDKEELSSLSGWLEGIVPPCGISEARPARDLPLSRLVEQAAYAFYEGYITGRRAVVRYHPGNDAAIGTMIQTYDEAYAQGNGPSLHRLTVAMPGELQAMGATMEDVLHLWNACVFACFRKEGLYKQLQYDTPVDIVRQYGTLDDMADALYQLALGNLRVGPAKAASQDRQTLEAMVSHIARAYASSLTLPGVAAAAGTNTTTANKLFRQYTNTTFAQYLTDFRISKACQLLAEDARSIEEIGYLVGYTDYFYFNKVFKKQLGITPYQYRKQPGENASLARKG